MSNVLYILYEMFQESPKYLRPRKLGNTTEIGKLGGTRPIIEWSYRNQSSPRATKGYKVIKVFDNA